MTRSRVSGKQSTKNDFVYGEFGRTSLVQEDVILLSNIGFISKVLTCEDGKYIKHIYKLMLSDLNERPNKVNWALRVCYLGWGFMKCSRIKVSEIFNCF